MVPQLASRFRGRDDAERRALGGDPLPVVPPRPRVEGVQTAIVIGLPDEDHAVDCELFEQVLEADQNPRGAS